MGAPEIRGLHIAHLALFITGRCFFLKGERARPPNLLFFVIIKFFSRQKKPIFSLFVYPIKRGARGNHLPHPQGVDEKFKTFQRRTT